MSNRTINEAYEYAIKNGALGGKLIGAGGGGFLLFYTNKPTHLRNAFRKKFEEVKFKFDYEGVKEIFEKFDAIILSGGKGTRIKKDYKTNSKMFN